MEEIFIFIFFYHQKLINCTSDTNCYCYNSSFRHIKCKPTKICVGRALSSFHLSLANILKTETFPELNLLHCDIIPSSFTRYSQPDP